jgi:membrane dipeptidase
LTERLHRDSIVVDTMGPSGPFVATEAILARLDEHVASGTAPALAIDEMDAMADDALLRGELDGFWKEWDRSGVDVCSVTLGAFGADPFTYENAKRDLARWQRKFDALDRLVKVTTSADAERVHDEGNHGVILNFQNTTHFGDDLAKLDEFYELGARIIQLTYNSRNLVGDGCMEPNPSGLTRFGLDVVRRMNELGILIDVSHCSEATAFDAAVTSEAAIAITHGFAKALNPHDRGASDDLIRTIGERGYVGVVCVPFFLTTDAHVTLDHLTRHIDHIAGLVGIDHVGIGTDWSPEFPPQLVHLLNEEVRRLGFRDEHRVDFAAKIEGLDAWADWPNLTKALIARGYSDDDVRGILGGNFLRLFNEITS